MANDRHDYQRTKTGLYFRQVVHPVSKKRTRVTAESRQELEARCDEIRRMRFDLRYGSADPQAVLQRMRPALKGRPLTVRELWARFEPALSPRSKEQAVSTWRNRLEPYFGDLSPWQLSEERMRLWLVKLQGAGFAPKTVRYAYDQLVRIYHQGIASGDVDRIPWKPWRPPPGKRRHEPAYLATLEDLAALLDAAHEYDRKYWTAGRYSHALAVCVVLSLTGLRHSEAAGLAWDCVDIDNATPKIRIWYQAKSRWYLRSADRPRDPPKVRQDQLSLHGQVARALRAQREQLRLRGWYKDDGPVFPDRNTGGWSRGGHVLCPVTFRKVVKAAGLPMPERWNLHSLRHSHSSLEVIFSGGDLRAAARRTRHADLAVLQGYVHAARRSDETYIPDDQLPQLLGPSASAALSGRPLPLLETTAGAPIAAPIAAPAELLGALGAAAEDDRDALQAPAALPAPAWDADSLEELARGFVLDGKPAQVPLPVRKGFRRAYERGYQRARRSGADKAACVAAGRRSRRASQGAWAQAVARAERQIAAKAG